MTTHRDLACMWPAPQPGDFAVVRTAGWKAAVIRWATRSPVNHAFVFVGGNKIVEANTTGVELSNVDKYDGDDITWSTRRLPASKTPLTQSERWDVIDAAEQFLGTPYGWLDIAVVALAQRRLGRLITSRSWIARRVSSMHALICSQLVDAAYESAGLHLFTDGRPAGLVTPGDLYRLIAPATPGRNAA